jgi:chromate transporter
MAEVPHISRTHLLLASPKLGFIGFGGGFVMIPMLQSEVVNGHHWLTAKEFAHSMATGQLKPGPVVITATFVGCKAAGLLGAWVASTAVVGLFLQS